MQAAHKASNVTVAGTELPVVLQAGDVNVDEADPVGLKLIAQPFHLLLTSCFTNPSFVQPRRVGIIVEPPSRVPSAWSQHTSPQPDDEQNQENQPVENPRPTNVRTSMRRHTPRVRTGAIP